MRKNDQQLGRPEKLFSGTTAEIAALTAVEGMIAWDETKGNAVTYDGADWVDVGSGTGSVVTSAGFVGARYSTDAGQSIPHASQTIINFEDKNYDTNNAVTIGASWIFTAPQAGHYHIDASAMFSNTSNWGAGESATLNLYKNDAFYSTLYRHQVVASVSQYLILQGSDTLYLDKDDTIHIKVYQDSGDALTLLSQGDYNYIAISQLTTVSISGFVGARYSTDAGQTFSTGVETVVDFEDKTYDTDDAVTTGSGWKFTAPKAGYYLVSVNFLFTDDSWTAGNVARAILLKNDALYSYFVRNMVETTNTKYMPSWGSDTIYLEEGDYISIKMYQNSGSDASLFTQGEYNYVSISLISGISSGGGADILEMQVFS